MPAEGQTANRETNAQSELASPSPDAIIRNDSEVVNAENGAVGAAEKDAVKQIAEQKMQSDASVDGDFVLPETANEAESTPSGESPKTGSLATTKDSASLEKGVVGNSASGRRQTQTLIPDSNTIISNEGQSVNTENGAVGAAEKVTFLLPVLWLRSNWWILSAETIKWNDCINLKLFYKYFLHLCVYRCILMVIFWTRSKEMEE